MNKPAELWKLLMGFVPIIMALTSWMWYLSTKVEKHDTKIENVEQIQREEKLERKEGMNEIKSTQLRVENKVDQILIKIETKQDRK